MRELPDRGRQGAGSRFFTVLILPRTQARFRKLHLSYGFVSVACGLAALLLLAGLVAPHLWFRIQTQSLALEELRQQNRTLLEERGRFEGSLASVSDKLNEFQDRAGRIAEELGVANPAAAQPAAGGGVDGAQRQRHWFDGEFRSLESRALGLVQSYDVLGDAFDERKRRLAATPNAMPVQGWFSHAYGWRQDPFTGEREFHRGVDIVAPLRTDIRAPADGVVSRTGRYSDYGKSLDIAHGYGHVTRYGHMSEILVRAGDRVRRGDVIGRVGSTGRSTGPHLHYEVFRDGRHVNPWSYLGHPRNG